jgi:hypothetical protein
VATFNIYGSDHARLQGVATPAYMQRRGHATRLLQQVELLLADAGVQDMVVILEPQVMVEWRAATRTQFCFDTCVCPPCRLEQVAAASWCCIVAGSAIHAKFPCMQEYLAASCANPAVTHLSVAAAPAAAAAAAAAAPTG